MANFCSKCGFAIDLTTGLCPECDKEKTNSKPTEVLYDNLPIGEVFTDEPSAEPIKKKNKSKKTKALIAIICSICIVIGTVFVVNIFGSSDSELPSFGDYNSFMEGFTDVLVTDKKSAIKAAASVGDVLGITDAEKELKVVSVNKVDNDTFYRMQQYFNDIPVYGKSIVISADKKGNATALTSNFAPVSNSVFLTPTAAKEDIKKSMQDYFNGEKVYFTLDNNNLVLYQTENSGFVLAYNLEVRGINFIINANTSEILNTSSLINQAMVDCGYKKENQEATFRGIKISNNEYMIGDEEKGLFVFNADGKPTLKREDKDGKPQHYSIPENIATMTSKDNYFGNNDEFPTDEYAKAVYMLEKLHDFANLYNNFNKNQITSSAAIINDGYDLNGLYGGYLPIEEVTTESFPYNKEKIISLVLGSDVSKDIYGTLDAIGHEYAHGINRSHLTFDNDEGDAINEAYADILGHTSSAQIYGKEPDWIIANRNLSNPKECNGENFIYPVTINELNEAEWFIGEGDVVWYYTKPKRKGSTDYSHFASTIISHTAYSMWNGIDGTETRKISTDKLGKLFYKSLMFMQDNPTFSQCRNAVELAARSMLKDENKENRLTEEQYKTVTTAFDNAGIENDTFTYNHTVKNQFDLSVLSSDGTENTSYKLKVIKFPRIKAGPNVKNEMPKVIKEETVYGRQSLELEDGTYALCIIDVSDGRNISKSINIKIVVDGSNSNSKDLVTVNTDFTDVIVVELDDTPSNTETTKTVLSPESAVDIYMANKSIWMENPEYMPMQGYGYCLLDLDFDGVLELISSNNDGSVRASTNSFFKINLEKLTVEEFNSNLVEDDKDVGGSIDYYAMAHESKLLKNISSGKMFYLFKNYTRVSSDEGLCTWSESYMKDGKLCENYLFSEYFHPDYENNTNEQITEYSFNGEDISKAGYEKKTKAYYAENKDLKLTWKTIYGEDFDNTSNQKQKQLLLDAYRSFSYDGFSFDEIETYDVNAKSEKTETTESQENNASNIWKQLPDEFYFSSGAGAWGTIIEIKDDGSFTGGYHDSNAGETGAGHPNGSRYECSFSGKFSTPKKLSKYIYKMKLEYLDLEEKPGKVSYEDGVKIITSDPYGFDNANEFYIYLPGAPVSQLEDGFLEWVRFDTETNKTLPKNIYGIYNISGRMGFSGGY
ncbi:MAG: M4 family metallopeptidase [Clostridia bacterium]|nr:M4 family metallopeptidase [Clostridia bacterium]